MKTVDIFRVENSQGEGMYTARDTSLQCAGFSSMCTDTHPQFDGPFTPNNYVFGFPNFMLAAHWLLSIEHFDPKSNQPYLNNAPLYLARHGFRLNQYCVKFTNNVMCLTGTQCKFSKTARSTKFVASLSVMSVRGIREEIKKIDRIMEPC